MRNPRSQSFSSVLVWTGENDTKNASVDENILLRFGCEKNRILLKTHYCGWTLSMVS